MNHFCLPHLESYLVTHINKSCWYYFLQPIGMPRYAEVLRSALSPLNCHLYSTMLLAHIKTLVSQIWHITCFNSLIQGQVSNPTTWLLQSPSHLILQGLKSSFPFCSWIYIGHDLLLVMCGRNSTTIQLLFLFSFQMLRPPKELSAFTVSQPCFSHLSCKMAASPSILWSMYHDREGLFATSLIFKVTNPHWTLHLSGKNWVHGCIVLRKWNEVMLIKKKLKALDRYQ
jgi:hypothetical protein